MAADLRALRAWLTSAESVAAHRDDIVRDLSCVVNASGEIDSTRLVQELVLRALEFRSVFGPLAVVVDSLARERGLYPYLQPDSLGISELLAYEAHRPFNLDDIVLHQAQAAIYDLLLRGESVILSAPTSFGKSLLIDAVIANGKYRNVVVVVPSIALIDETRRRLAKKFGVEYKVITHVGQPAAEKNIFVFTQERVLEYRGLPPIDFFVIDEFYKLDPGRDADRALLLNQAFYRLQRTGAQFYLLGPNIRRLPIELPDRLNCRFIATDYATVVSETVRVQTTRYDRLERLVALALDLQDPTLIYCASPASARRVATTLLGAMTGQPSIKAMEEAAEWIGDQYHPDWAFSRALRHGIGIHHGRIPRSLAQFTVRAFNDERLRFLVCTSTLIEGVNTKAKNVIVYDNRVAMQKLDYFTFNNIRGRSGRMFQHFVGHVYLFSDPPVETLPFVDMPAFTQSEETPPSLLIQLEDEDLTENSRRKLQHLSGQDWLPIDVIKANNGLDPDAQVALAKEVTEMKPVQQSALMWTGPSPSFDQLVVVCELIWKYFLGSPGKVGGVFSARQLAYRLSKYRSAKSVRSLIIEELAQQRSDPDTDDAVEDVLEFLRYWATFNFPRYLMAVDRIVKSVFRRKGLGSGDFTMFAARLENQFLPAGVAALDEYGVPVQVGRKISARLGHPDSLDDALEMLRTISADEELGLSAFELSLLVDAIDGL
jgi:hypothetical protein